MDEEEIAGHQSHPPKDYAQKHPRMKAAEIANHPAYPTTTWRLLPTQEGMLDVAKTRGGPIKLSWEVHGEGKEKLVWIMGLGAIKSSWQRQTMKFGHYKGDQYSPLIFDNRGVGASSKPIMRYSTSEMAKDLIELLDHLGWTKDRELNVVGVSMGGMIAQELAYLIPNRINSLALCSTVARIERTIPFLENLKNRVSLFIPKSLDSSLENAAWNMFPDAWLDLPDQSKLPGPDTPKCLPPANAKTWEEGQYLSFPNNFARFAAQEITKRADTEAFQRKGFMMQAVAAGWHHMSPERLKKLGDMVGRERIVVLHGTEDRMLTFPHGETLNRELQPGEYYPIKGAGHVLFLEDTEWHDGMLEKLWKKANALSK